MSRELYSTLSGARAAWVQLEVVANNLANASTAGFKQQKVAFSLEGLGEHPMSQAYVDTDITHFDHSDGPLQQDDVPTHLALRGPGFFAVDAPEGERLVRSGAFELNHDGSLVTAEGHRVQGSAGSVEIPPGMTFSVLADGTVLDGTGAELDRLRIVLCDEVEPMGASGWRPLGEVREAEGTRVVQGALEGSNADPLANLVDLVEASRYFEVYQKAMQTSDEMDSMLNQTA